MDLDSSILEISQESSSESDHEIKPSKPLSYHPQKNEIFGRANKKPFRLLLAASSGSGKSQLIKSIMTD